jgi:hypothetical protein
MDDNRYRVIVWRCCAAVLAAFWTAVVWLTIINM